MIDLAASHPPANYNVCRPPVYFSPQQVGVVTSRCDINLKLNWWLWSWSRYWRDMNYHWLPVSPSSTSNRAFVECSSWHEDGSVTNCIRWILEMKFQFDDQTSNLLVLMVHSKQHSLSHIMLTKTETREKRSDDERQTTVYVLTSIPASDLEFSPSSHFLLSRQNKWLLSQSVWLELSVTQTHWPDNTSQVSQSV